MTDIDALQTLLREQPCRDVRVERRPDGALMLRAPFRYPDGDEYPVHIAEAGPARWRLSDRGHTLMRLSYEHNVDSLMDGPRGALVERIVAENGLHWQGGALCLDAAADDLPKAVSRFGQTLARIYDSAPPPHPGAAAP